MSMPNPFAPPGASNSGVAMKDLLGALVVFRPRTVIKRWAQPSREKPREFVDVTVAAVHVVWSTLPVHDGQAPRLATPDQPITIDEMLIFSKPLQRELASQLHEDGSGMILGRLQQKPSPRGGMPAWTIVAPEPGSADLQAGLAWHQQHAATLPPLPALPVSDPPQDPKAQPAAPPAAQWAAPGAPAQWPGFPPAGPYPPQGWAPQSQPAAPAQWAAPAAPPAAVETPTPRYAAPVQASAGEVPWSPAPGQTPPAPPF